MLFGKDLSYCSYANQNIIGELKLYDMIAASDVVINTHYSYACCNNITSITSYDLAITNYTYSYNFSYSYEYYKQDILYEVTTTGYNYLSYDYISKFVTANTGYIYDMSGMFKECTYLTNANLFYMNPSKCINMDEMFANCINLKTVTFGEYVTQDTLHCENMFKNCYNLETVYIPYSFKNYYNNIIGQNDLHVEYYNHPEPDLQSYSYTYIYSITERPTRRYLTFTLGSIGCIMMDDFFRDIWDTIRITIGGKTIFLMKLGQYQSPDAIIAENTVLNNQYIGKTINVDVPYEYAKDFIPIECTLFKGIEYICTITEHFYFTEGVNNTFDIHSIYFKTNPEIITTYIDFGGGNIQSYTRSSYSSARGTFNAPELKYDYPDGELYTIIDARTGVKSVEVHPKFDETNRKSYVIVSADLVLDNETTYLVRLRNQ